MRASSRSRTSTAAATIGPLVQHHAFGARRHGGVGHLAARGNAVLDEAFQDLRRPHDRHARRLTDPEDLLLHLRQTFEADLGGEIAARDHDAERASAACCGDQVRQVAHRRGPLDLGDKAKRPDAAPVACERILEQLDVARPADEGIADHVGAFDDRGEIRLVLCRQRRETEGGVGQVDALFRLELRAPLLRPLDAHNRLAAAGALDDPFELAVVVAKAMPRLETGDDFRQRHGRAERHVKRRPRRTGRDEAEGVAGLKPRLGFGQGDRAGADLRTGNVHQNLQPTSDGRSGGLDVAGHRPPGFYAVMSAIDARHVHSTAGERYDPVAVDRGLGWQGDHDAAAAVAWRSAEEAVRGRRKPGFAGKEVVFCRRSKRRRTPFQRRQRGECGVERGQHTAFQTAERGQASPHQLPLQHADVVMSEREIVGEIDE